ncbi:MAG TPA: DUF5998 family protein [Actinomycetes bacterium]|nr:DUF5998 family protein [Actinomycetes bacterium]
MAHPTSVADLRVAIDRCGYYPDLVAETVESAIAGEQVRAFLVHHEATFDRDELRRHVTVLVLTPSRLVVGHTDDSPPDESSPTPYAISSVETVPLSRIGSIAVSRTVADPDRYRGGQPARDVVVTLGWGAISRVDLEPASCGDPECDADHGYTGTLSADDLSVRVSDAGDGQDAVRQALAFAGALSTATAGARG